MKIKNCKLKISRGFTLTELIIVIGIMITLLSFATFDLLGAQHKTSLDSAITLLVSDLRQQQLQAMVGNGNGTETGVHFDPDHYTVFSGLTYTNGNSTNFAVNLQSSLRFKNITLTGSQVIFASGSGEATTVSPGSDTFDLQNTSGLEKKTLKINKYGVVTSVN